ncbi:Tannase/feruloyl esterase [Microdochium trichocladiopsis]|uniref:Carboxylic ester hydrolase n=1 Tax=Microdochium trichocladiopsis TaxID=1682393 RepID=A0A9P9BKQ3_9PEZI|nr:Tannase/feruloyl esterase [Microdochium trichocladiopsis]KAH7021446.1 Tannase/feruloyl esterase [Microdochium trichocladiopsis]
MNDIGQHPFGCEIDAITAATIAACDELDGMRDGVISDVAACAKSFDPQLLVGQTIKCKKFPGGDPEDHVQITQAAVDVARTAWKGIPFRPYGDGSDPIDYKYNMGADLTGNSPTSGGGPGSARTSCNSDGVCVGVPNGLIDPWFKYFITQDRGFNVTAMTREEFWTYFEYAQEKFQILQTTDPDLTEFRRAGGKMVTFHGLADQVIPDIGTQTYYEAVSDILPDVRDFYRYFQAPGVSHCGGGTGGYPRALFAQLRAWVENGTAPDSTPVQFTDSSGTDHRRILCPYPLGPVFDKGCVDDGGGEECWTCV